MKKGEPNESWVPTVLWVMRLILTVAVLVYIIALCYEPRWEIHVLSGLVLVQTFVAVVAIESLKKGGYYD